MKRMADEELDRRFRYASNVSGGAHVLREEMTRARAREARLEAVLLAVQRCQIKGPCARCDAAIRLALEAE